MKRGRRPSAEQVVLMLRQIEVHPRGRRDAARHDRARAIAATIVRER